MAVSYAGRAALRPSNGWKMPLLLRNPQDVTGAHSQGKLGPNAMLCFGPNDYRMWVESLVWGSTNPLTNWMKFGRGVSPWNWQLRGDADDIQPLAVGTWENGEICPTDWWYDEYDDVFRMIYHGGNNSGDRQIGLMEAPRTSEGLPGSWARYGSGPVLTVSGASPDDNDVADGRVVRISRDLYILLYRGVRISDNKSQICRATSTDRGRSWTRDVANNPVLALGASGDNDDNMVAAPFPVLDSDGRIHIWYVGEKASDTVMRVLYAFSDDDAVTWTRNASQVVIGPSGTSTNSDANVGDVVSGLVDEGLILLNCLNFNLSSYTDGRGRLEGRGQYWLPREAATQPARPGRAFPTGTDRMDVNSSAGLLNSSVATIYVEFKLPPIAGSNSCHLYTESAAFNKQIYFRINNSDGSLELWWRTPTGIANTRVKGRRWDDGLFHWAAVRRTATNAFEIIADGRVIGTNSTTVGTDATPANVSWGGWPAAEGLSEPFLGIIRRGITIQGTAWTLAQLTAIWNEGRGGVTPPNTPTFSAKFGSGGAAGPDAAQDGATYGATVGSGTIVVNAEMAQQLIRPAGVRSLAHVRMAG